MKKTPNRTRRHNIHVMFDDEEIEALRAWMKESGIATISQALREWVCGLIKKG